MRDNVGQRRASLIEYRGVRVVSVQTVCGADRCRLSSERKPLPLTYSFTLGRYSNLVQNSSWQFSSSLGICFVSTAEEIRNSLRTVSGLSEVMYFLLSKHLRRVIQCVQAVWGFVSSSFSQLMVDRPMGLRPSVPVPNGGSN